MKVIVHIGTEKTGSTSIQEYLYQNNKQLNKAGYYYYHSCSVRNSRALASYCMGDHKNDDFIDDKGVATLRDKLEFKRGFLKEFKNEMESIPKEIHTVIISSEHLHSRLSTQEEINKLYELLSIFSDVKIVCYLRKQLNTCTSLYSTAIKSGGNISFSDFISSCKPENIYYNYYEALVKWEAVFGLNSLDVCLFNSKYFFNEDLLDDFTVKINSDLIGKLNKNITVENESLTYTGQVLGRAINKVFSGDMGKSCSNITRNKCHRIIYKKCKGKGETASIDTQNEIYNNFIECNEKLRQKFFPEQEVLFDSSTKEVKSSKIIDEAFIDVLSDVIGEMLVEWKKQLEVKRSQRDEISKQKNAWQLRAEEREKQLEATRSQRDEISKQKNAWQLRAGEREKQLKATQFQSDEFFKQKNARQLRAEELEKQLKATQLQRDEISEKKNAWQLRAEEREKQLEAIKQKSIIERAKRFFKRLLNFFRKRDSE